MEEKEVREAIDIYFNENYMVEPKYYITVATQEEADTIKRDLASGTVPLELCFGKREVPTWRWYIMKYLKL